MGLFGRKNRVDRTSQLSEETVVQPPIDNYYSRPTFLRIFTILVYLAAVVFMILVEIGNINDKPVIRDTYFINIDLTNIIPESVPNAQLINSLAQSIGLHDFYQVGLWNYCEGYNGQGITDCSKPVTLYWFNPVEILLNQLLAGATIVLPEDLVNILGIIRVASRWMFALFLVGTILTFLSMFFAPMAFSKKPRWTHRGRRIFLRSLPITILTFLALLFTAAAAVIATVMFVIFRNVLANGAAELNIKGELGIQMLAFEWVAVGLNLIGFIMQIGTCCGICCCTGRRRAMRKNPMLETSVVEK